MKKNGVIIGRPINGISINGNEYVCDKMVWQSFLLMKIPPELF